MRWLLLLTAAASSASSSAAAASHHDRDSTQLQRENVRLRTLNARLRTYIEHFSNSATTTDDATAASFLQVDEEPINNHDDDAKAEANSEIAANKKASEQAIDNFCLAPAECQEKLFACRRRAIEKCWQTDYAKGGAPPGAGDLDQDRLSEINKRVKQKLSEIGIDIDCDPSESGVDESMMLGASGAAASSGNSGSGGAIGGDASGPGPKSRFLSTDINLAGTELESGLEEGIVKLNE